MWIDSFVGFFSPRAKFRRLQFRNAAKVLEKRGYEAASRTRRTSKWRTASTSANAETQNAIPILRDRARDLVRNDPYAARAVQLIAHNTVGKGIMANITGPESVQNSWKSWAESTQIDWDGCQNFYGIQNLIMKSVPESGEVLVRRRRINPQNGGLPIKLQVLESDHLVNTLFTKNPNNENRIIQGVEVNNDDEVVAYHLYKNHPGNSGVDMPNNPLDTVRVPADDIAHIYLKNRPGQVRGVTWLAPVMIMIRDYNEFQDAMLVRQKVAACFSAFISDIEPPADTTTAADEFDLEYLEPGIVEHLPPGKNITFGSPPMPPAGTYDAYVKTILHSLATGLGTSYEALSGDLAEVNFSSARMGWLEFGRNIDSWRSLMLIPQFNDKVFGWFLEAAALSGIQTDGTSTQWTAPARQMIDPTKEIPAHIKAIRAGISTLSDVIRQYGKHPSAQFEEIKQDNEIIDKNGLILDSDPRKVTASGSLQKEEGTEPAAPADSEEDEA